MQLEDVKQSLQALDKSQVSAEENTAERQEQARRLMEEVYQKRQDTEALRNQTQDQRVTLATRNRGLEAAIADRDRLIQQADNLEKMIEDAQRMLEECLKRLEASARTLEEDNTRLVSAREELDRFRTLFEATDARRTEAQRITQELNARMEELRKRSEEWSEKRHRMELQRTRVEAEFKQVQDRIWEDYELTYAGAEEFRVEGFKITESEKRIAAIRARIREMGVVNVSALDEYRQTTERLEELTNQRDDLQKAEQDLQNIVEELERKMEAQFKREFAVLNQNFQRTFVKLFGGGKAELLLSDPSDALNCEIEVVAQPPGKKLQMLTLLSGGERALTAIAILFAMLDLKPTPFCVLDEIEAALDDANIDNYAEYLKSYSQDTQFVVITHRKGTMERCDALYGVVMEEKGVSKMVSVELNDAV